MGREVFFLSLPPSCFDEQNHLFLLSPVIMAAQVVPITPIRLPTGPSTTTAEQRYWQSFKSPSLISSPSNNPITHVSFPAFTSAAQSTLTECFAVTSSRYVQLYSTRTRKIVKTLNRFNEPAHSAEIRRDGRVIVAGDESGLIQVFDVDSRAILKTWKEHKQPVWTTKFNPNETTQLMSASDDRTVRLWDLASQESVLTMSGHGDYVRCGAFMPGQAVGLVVSGSYDQTVKLWDPRAGNTSIMTFKHAAPVEAVLPMPVGTTILSAADNQMTVLDIIAGKPLQIVQNHQKTITTLALASNNTRVVSGGLDGHLKVYETAGWNVVYGSKYPSAILSLCMVTAGIGRDDRHLAVGMQSGLLSIRTRLSGQAKIRERERQKEMQALVEGRIAEHDKQQKKKLPSGIRKRLRGIDYKGEGADIIINLKQQSKRKKSSKWEKALHAGRYANSLDLALQLNDPSIAITALTTLRQRSALREALTNRDEEQLQPILRWIHRYIIDPRYVNICVEAGIIILDLYAAVVGQSPQVDALLSKLHHQVQREVDRAQQAWQTEGMLQMLMTP